MKALREENARLRWVVKGAHGALTDAATVVVPGALDGDLKPAIRQITRERDEARQQLTCIDLWLRRRQPVTHESATLRSVQEFVATVERERDEARVTKDMHKERAQEAWAEVARLEGLILGWALTPEDEFEGRDNLIEAAKEIEARRIREGRG